MGLGATGIVFDQCSGGVAELSQRFAADRARRHAGLAEIAQALDLAGIAGGKQVECVALVGKPHRGVDKAAIFLQGAEQQVIMFIEVAHRVAVSGNWSDRG